jgi:acyl-CoA thioesterase I
MKRMRKLLFKVTLNSCRAAWPLMLALGMAACGGGGGDSPAPAVDPRAGSGTWVVMGSSTAAGAGASPGRSWAALIQADVLNQGIKVINIAKGGSVTYEGLSSGAAPTPDRPVPDPLANIDQALSRSPSLIVVAYPSNDTALGYSVQETVDNLLSIRRQALLNSVSVVLVSSQPRNLSAAQLDQLTVIDEQLSAAVGPCFVDVRTGLAGADGHLAPQYDSGDHVHPNDAGHELMATRIEAVINGRACIQATPAGANPRP